MASEGSRIAIVGQAEVILPLRAAGLDVFPVEPAGDARQMVERLISQGYQLIYFTDDLSAALQPLVERYRSFALPCLVALPFTGEAGEDRLRAAVRRAAGADILGAKMPEEKQ
ncbi:MAG: V-type ATP synthase subunit F [candidate division WOR-3 bacterium]